MTSRDPYQSLETLYRSLQPGLLHFAVNIVRNRDDAEELVNDAFLAVWQRRDTLQLDNSLRAYLFTAVRNRCLNHLKKPRLLWETEADDDFPEPISADITEKLSAAETEALISRLIDRLPLRCRQIFLLSRIEQLSHREIATLMDLSVKTVENQIGIALKYLKECLYSGKGSGNLDKNTIRRYLHA